MTLQEAFAQLGKCEEFWPEAISLLIFNIFLKNVISN